MIGGENCGKSNLGHEAQHDALIQGPHDYLAIEVIYVPVSLDNIACLISISNRLIS